MATRLWAHTPNANLIYTNCESVYTEKSTLLSCVVPNVLTEKEGDMWIDFFEWTRLYLMYIMAYACSAHLTVLSVSLYLHRHQTHQSIGVMHPVLSHFFRFWLYLTTGMRTKEWVAVHRKHHATVDTSEDPHSPYTRGLWRVVFFGVWLYRKEAGNHETVERYGKHTPDDWIERHIYTPFNFTGVLILLAAYIMMFGFPGAMLWLCHIATIPLLGASVINGFGHAWGYRNFETPDQSRNIVPFGCLIGGEELHNNHHRYQCSAKFSIRPWEVDIGWMYILIFGKLSLVDKVRTDRNASFPKAKDSIPV